MKKKNILDEREQVISKAQTKFYEIYSEIMDASELSVYQSEMLANKLLILSTELDEYMEAHNKYIKELKNKYKNIAYGSLVIAFINITLMFVNPLLAIIISLLMIKIVQNAQQKWEFVSKSNILTKLETIKITATNCVTFLEVKNNKREERIEKLDPVNKYEFTMANNFLQSFLNAEDVSQLIVTLKGCDVSIKNILLKILQEDLHMDSDNLEELLNIARTKVSMENLEPELKLCRNLPKKEEI